MPAYTIKLGPSSGSYWMPDVGNQYYLSNWRIDQPSNVVVAVATATEFQRMEKKMQRQIDKLTKQLAALKKKAKTSKRR